MHPDLAIASLAALTLNVEAAGRRTVSMSPRRSSRPKAVQERGRGAWSDGSQTLGHAAPGYPSFNLDLNGAPPAETSSRAQWPLTRTIPGRTRGGAAKMLGPLTSGVSD